MKKEENVINPLMPGDNQVSYVLKQICSFTRIYNMVEYLVYYLNSNSNRKYMASKSL